LTGFSPRRGAPIYPTLSPATPSGSKSHGDQPSFTVRKMSFGQGVERIFPTHSKVIDKIEVLRSAHVRRAKLYYLRALRGKAARLREVDTKRS